MPSLGHGGFPSLWVPVTWGAAGSRGRPSTPMQEGKLSTLPGLYCCLLLPAGPAVEPRAGIQTPSGLAKVLEKHSKVPRASSGHWR